MLNVTLALVVLIVQRKMLRKLSHAIDVSVYLGDVSTSVGVYR